MSRRAFVLVPSAVLLGLLVVVACTGDDPELTPSPADAGTDAPALNDVTAPDQNVPSDASDAGAEAGLLALKCRLDLNVSKEVRKTAPGVRLDPEIRLVPRSSEMLALVTHEEMTDTYEVHSQDMKVAAGLASVVPLGLPRGKVLAVTPTTGPAGHALLAVEDSQDDAGNIVPAKLVTLFVADGSNPLQASPVRTELLSFQVPPTSISGTFTEVTAGQYFYVIEYQEADGGGNFDFACGHTPGGTLGPKPFATFTTRQALDSNLMLPDLVGGTLYYVQAGTTSAGVTTLPTTTYHLPLTGNCAMGSPQTTFAVPDGGRPPYPLGSARSAIESGKFALFFGDPDPDIARFTAYGARVDSTNFPQSQATNLGAAPFKASPQLTIAELPLGAYGTRTAYGDFTAQLGAAMLTSNGFNFVIYDSDGRIRAKNVGDAGFLGDRAADIKRIAIARAQHYPSGIATFFIAWIEKVGGADASGYDVLYANRISCIPE